MRKIVIEKPGGYSRLKIVNDNNFSKDLTENDVLVEISYFGINYADCLIRMGLYKSAKDQHGYPICPGFEYTGIIKKVGKNVTQLNVGDSVFGVSLFNAYAEEIVVSQEYVFKIPKHLTHEEIVTIPTAFLTAYHMMFNLANINKSKNILIHSAAGGVGSFLVQLAKIQKCYVIGAVGSSSKISYLHSLGVDMCVDSSTQDFSKEVNFKFSQGVDVVFDANGVSTLKKSYNSLGKGGKLVVYGFHSMIHQNRKGEISLFNKLKLIKSYMKTPTFSSFNLVNSNKSILGCNLSYLFNETDLLQEAMRYLITHLEKGTIKPLKYKVFDFEDIQLAHREIESRKSTGKLIIKVR